MSGPLAITSGYHNFLLLAGADAGLQVVPDTEVTRGVFSLIPLQLIYSHDKVKIGRNTIDFTFSPADFKINTNAQFSYRPRVGVGVGAKIFEASALLFYGLADIGLEGDREAYGGGIDFCSETRLLVPGLYVEAQHDVGTGETSVMFGLRWAHASPYSWISE